MTAPSTTAEKAHGEGKLRPVAKKLVLEEKKNSELVEPAKRNVYSSQKGICEGGGNSFQERA